MFRNILKINLLQNFGKIKIFKQNLYSASVLGIDNFVEAKNRVEQQFGENCDKFKDRIRELISKEDDGQKRMVFTEDLRNMIHMANDSKDIEAVTVMIKKFNSQNKELRFGNFVFGPVVMRMLYTLKDPDTAFKFFTDPQLEGFFDQIVSYQILLDLLYENQRYQDVLDLFEIIKSKQIQGAKYSKYVICLVFGSCYKLNTLESFEYCKQLWQELQNVGHIPMRKATTFAAGLAYKQNQPQIAIEILSIVREQQYLTIRNLKVLSFVEIGRLDECLAIFKSILEADKAVGNTKQTFLSEVVEKVKEGISQNKKELETEFERIVKCLKDNGQITNDTLDDILCREILTTSFSNNDKNSRKPFVFNKFSNQQRNNYPRNDGKRHIRQGLKDLY